MNQESKKLWRDALGSDAAWDAMRFEEPPPLAASFSRPERKTYRPWAIAASCAALAVSIAVNVLLFNELSATRSDYLLASLNTESSPMRLATLDTLRRQKLSDDMQSALKDVVRYSSDPNAQLAALELLLGAGLSSRQGALDKLLDETRDNAAFLRAATSDTKTEST